MNLSLISFQIMRVISSPSSSTTGFLTLIFLKEELAILRDCTAIAGRVFLVKEAGCEAADLEKVVRKLRDSSELRVAFMVAGGEIREMFFALTRSGFIGRKVEAVFR